MPYICCPLVDSNFRLLLARCNPVLPGAGNMSASIASIEGYIRQSEESQGSIVVVLKQGYLLKRSSNIRKEWKRRFFVLDSLGMLYYYSNKVPVHDAEAFYHHQP